MESMTHIVSYLIISITFGLITSVLAELIIKRSWKRKSSTGETIEDRVAKLTKSLTEATMLIGHIEGEIRARSSLATQLQQDLDRYNQLVEIKKPEVEAIAQLLRGELRKEGSSTFWKGFIVNFIFFVMGAAVSLTITILTK